MDRGIVELDVQNGPPVIFYGVFRCCEDNNDNQGNGIQPRIDTTKNGENLQEKVISTHRFR